MSINRRNFLKKTSLSTAAIASTPLFSGYDSEVNNLSPSGGLYMGDFAAQKLSKIRAAFIGVGSRGGGHLNFFAGLPDTVLYFFCGEGKRTKNPKSQVIRHHKKRDPSWSWTRQRTQ